MTRLRRAGSILAFVALLFAAASIETSGTGSVGEGHHHGPAFAVEQEHAARGGHDTDHDAGHADTSDRHVHGATGCGAVGCTAFVLAVQTAPLVVPAQSADRPVRRERSDGCCYEPPHGPPRATA